MSWWTPGAQPGSIYFDGAAAWEEYLEEQQRREGHMITVMLDDAETEVFLPRVDHFTQAYDAAHALWEAVYKQARISGGAAFLLSPEDRGEAGWGVSWHRGPKQWADAYVVSEGAEAPGFSAHAERGEIVVFTDTN